MMNLTNTKETKCFFNRRGVTLLENMIAMLIFTIVLLGAASMQVRSMRINAEARRAFHHSLVATEYLETILALPFDDPLLADPDDGYAPAVADHGPFMIASGRGTIEWEVDARFPVPDTKRVSITVRTSGDPGRRKVSTYDYIKTKGFE
jgi:prepilin-type N-terminal cleavage/methylation domain-containing protein